MKTKLLVVEKSRSRRGDCGKRRESENHGCNTAKSQGLPIFACYVGRRNEQPSQQFDGPHMEVGEEATRLRGLARP